MSFFGRILISIILLVKIEVVLAGQTDINLILQKSKSSLDWANSFSAQMQMDAQATVDGTNSGRIKEYITYNKNGDFLEWKGLTESIEVDGSIGENTYLMHKLIDDKWFFKMSKLKDKEPQRAFFSSDVQANRLSLLENVKSFAPIIGRTWGIGHGTIVDLVIETDNKKIIREEVVNGIKCEVIQAITEHGKVELCLASSMNYTPVKWSLVKPPGAYIYTEPGYITDNLSVYEVKEFMSLEFSGALNSVNDSDGDVKVFIPAKSSFSDMTQNRNGTVFENTYKYLVEKIAISPDFNEIDAFKLDLPIGTRVVLKEFPHIKYIWDGNKPIVNVADDFLDLIENEVSSLNGGPENLTVDTLIKKETAVLPLSSYDQEELLISSAKSGNTFSWMIIIALILSFLFLGLIVLKFSTRRAKSEQ